MARVTLTGLVLCSVAAARGAAQTTGPTLYVNINEMPDHVFPPGAPPVQVTSLAGQSVAIRWQGAASAGRTIDAYRWGWNVQNPDDDEQWEQSWCPCTSAPPRVFNSGTQRFMIEARDSAGERTLAVVEIVVIRLAVEPAAWTAVKLRFGR